jgi:hypothetical protein
MGGFLLPKGLGHACKAIMQCIATKLMLALKDVIDRFFNQVPGRTSFAAFISIRIFRAARRLTGNHPRRSFWIRRFASGDNLDKVTSAIECQAADLPEGKCEAGERFSRAPSTRVKATAQIWMALYSSKLLIIVFIE